MLETSWLWFVISKEYVKLTRPKIESRDPIFFAGTRSRSRVSGNDRLFPRGSEFGPNLEIPAGPAIQLRPGPVNLCNVEEHYTQNNDQGSHLGMHIFQIQRYRPEKNEQIVIEYPKAGGLFWLRGKTGTTPWTKNVNWTWRVRLPCGYSKWKA